MTPKRTLEELILIYQTEAQLIDVFCEGPSDFSIFNFLADAAGSKTTAVYTADQIEWPDELDDFEGNRGRIVFLSNQLSARNLNGVCIVDKDLDTIVNQTADNGNLIKSDYACVDMYGLDTDDLQDFFWGTFNIKISAGQLAATFDACRHLFAIRFLRKKYCAGSRIANADEIMTDPTTFSFSVQAYLERCKQLNGYDVRWDSVIQHQNALYASLQGDFRDYINVHDLGEILATIIRKLKRRAVHIAPDFIVKHLVYFLITQRRFGYPLFSKLSMHLTG
jgi:hypothetical protein